MGETQPTYKERYNLAMLAINDGLWDWNLKTGKVFFDERYFTMAGYKPNEFPHNFEEWEKRVHPEDLPAVMQSIEDHLSNKNDSFDVEFRFKTKIGKWMWIRGRGKAVEYDKNGNVTRFIGTHTDISKQKEAEQQLLEANKRYETVLENALEGVFVLQGNHVVFANKAIQEITGYNLSEMTNRPFLDAVYEKDRAHVYDAYQRRLAGETIPSYDMRILSKSGKVRWFLLNSIKIKWEGKDAVLVFAQDIHERKLVEQKLKDSETRFKALHNASFGGIVIHDKGLIIDCNLGLSQITGYDKNELIGMDGLNLIAPEQRKSVIKQINDGIEEPYESVALRKNGTTFPVRLQAKNIPYLGKTVRVTEFRDITTEKEVLNALVESQERLSLITNSVDSIIFSLKVEKDKFRFDFINDKFFEDTGYTRKDFIGKLVEDVMPHEKSKLMIKKYHEAINKRKVIKYEENSPYKDGMRTGLVSVSPIFNENDECTHILGTVSDITNRVKAEKALKTSEKELRNLNATKDRLFSIIGHDLRNPLNNIFGFAFLLQRRVAQYNDKKMNKYIEAISQSAHGVSDLLENLLEWSRTQTQEIKVEKGNFYLNEIVEANLKLFYNSAKAKKIKLISKIKPGLMINADKTMLSTVMRNLISNAIKFTPENGQIIVSAEQIAGETTVRVHDTGIGMNEKTVKNLFDTNDIQVNSGTSGEKGTGLGLMICKEFIDLHNGKIWAESTEGKGSTFIFVI